MDVLDLLWQTLLLRPYVFVFLGTSLASAHRLLGWKRTGALFGITWGVAFLSEYSSTRIGFPFGDYYYTGSTVDQEIYIANVPFMDSLSFSFLLYASYCLALSFVLPLAQDQWRQGWHWERTARTAWPVVCLSVVFFTFIDIVIDPVALRGDRWFLGRIYDYPDRGIYFGVPLANFLGWAFVGSVSLLLYRMVDRIWWAKSSFAPGVVRGDLLAGVGLYYGVLAFNLAMTFWIGEPLIGIAGCFVFMPVTALLVLRLLGQLPMGRRA